MAWIKLHQSLWEHRKTIMLAAQLEIDEIKAAGHMARLWTWALDNAPDGSLERLPNIAIARGAGWPGDAEEFVTCALDVGFIDDVEDVFHLHDWYEYAGKYIDKKRLNAERMREARASKDDERATHVQRTDDAQVEHVLTRAGARSRSDQSNKKNKDHVSSDDYSPDFETFWKHYPRHKEKKGAFRVWKARMNDGTDKYDLILAAKNYATECQKENRDQRYIKHAATFLGPSAIYEDYLQVEEVVITAQRETAAASSWNQGLPEEALRAMEEDAQRE